MTPCSCVEDLINYAVRDRRRNIAPVGWSTFLSYLHEHNIPKCILTRSILDEFDGVLTHRIKKQMKTSPKIKMHESRYREVSPFHTAAQRTVKIKPHTDRHREVSPPQHAAKNAPFDFLKNYKNK